MSIIHYNLQKQIQIWKKDSIVVVQNNVISSTTYARKHYSTNVAELNLTTDPVTPAEDVPHSVTNDTMQSAVTSSDRRAQPNITGKTFCTFCSNDIKTSTQIDTLMEHIYNCHKDMCLECNFCGNLFPSKGQLNVHKKLVHNVVCRICTYCSPIFTSHFTMERHFNIQHLQIKQ